MPANLTGKYPLPRRGLKNRRGRTRSAFVNAPLQIIGQGLAGTCLAWRLLERGAAFEIIDRENGGSSRVAAGLINPITGKNFEPSWRIDEFLPEAISFYQATGEKLGVPLWFPMPVVRLAASEKERAKIAAKVEWLEKWRVREVSAPAGWHAAFEVHGGGRVDVRAFRDASREWFSNQGVYRCAEAGEAAAGVRVRCDGAAGLMEHRYGEHRCAKGEILTLRAQDWSLDEIRVGGGGWLVPIGDGLYKTGATYEWNQLDETPTEDGRIKVVAIAERLVPGAFEIIDHEAGIRPILRRSQPLIGPLSPNEWMFNGLGSKGSLYAPGVARRLTGWLLDGIEPDAGLDFRQFPQSPSF